MTIRNAKIVEKLLIVGVFVSALVMISFGLITTKMGIADDDTIRTVGNICIVVLLASWIGWRKIHSDRIRDETAEKTAEEPVAEPPVEY